MSGAMRGQAYAVRPPADNGQRGRQPDFLSKLLWLSPWLAPVFCGLLSMWAGQDVNWDLQNYHLYNPYAWLTGRIGADLAPGQWQSYFNPTIDVPYYLLVTNLPGWLCCFVMGLLHGLNFPLVHAIARRLLPPGSHPALPFWLAAAGCAGPAFLSELGNTMGDNLTALFVLGAILLVLQGQSGTRLLVAGLVMGLGTGLKLTNAVYALALCLALLVVDGTPLQRLQRAFVFGIGVLAGIAVSSGHWYWTMWQQFGNPLFPQLNALFHSPMAAEIGIGDTGWLPKSFLERLLWPFIFTLDPRRVCELPLRHLLWPVLYTGTIVLLALLATGRRRLAGVDRGVLMLLGFGTLAYLMWMSLFSIYRYLVPLELLAPLWCWQLLALLAPGRTRLAAACIALCACSAVTVGNWGHGGRAPAFTVEVPEFAQPAQSLVYIVQAPSGWYVPLFPADVRFISLGAGFPESPAWLARADAMRRARSGPFYVLLEADRADPAAQRSASELAEAAQRNNETLARAARTLSDHGLALLGNCRPYRAQIGEARFSYQLCEVGAKPD